MKYVKRICFWILFSLILQLSILALFNHFYFNRSSGFVEAIKYTEIGGFRVPDNAMGIKASFDGAYIGYMLDGKLTIQNLKDNKEEAILLEAESTGTYRWLPDREMIIFSNSRQSEGKKDIEIKTYDVLTKDERSYPWVENLPGSSEVTGIELSLLTNVVYVDIKVNPYEKQVYKYDIMNELKYVMTVPLNTVIREMMYKDVLLYQYNFKKLSVKNSKGATGDSLAFKEDRVFLGIDGADNIYMGEMNDKGLIEKILYEKGLGSPETDWKEILLKGPVLPETVKISENGEIYEIRENSIVNMRNGRVTAFSGQLIEILEEKIVTVQNHQVQLFPITAD